MKMKINNKLIRRIEYAGYTIYIYPKRITEKAVEFYLFNPKKELTRETIWIPKSSIERGKDGIDIYGLNWIFDDYKNREKVEKAGYELF